MEAFLANKWSLEDYLALDDGVMETNFMLWTKSGDKILADLAGSYLYRHPLESVKVNNQTKYLIPKLNELIKNAGFDPQYYTATNSAFDEPYDAYKPTGKNAHSPIEIMENDGTLVELSELSPLVKALNGTVQGDERFFFPKTMIKSLGDVQLFQPLYSEFQSYINNNSLQDPEKIKGTDF